MLLQQLMEATKFQISETVKYQWNCYGENANYLDFVYNGTVGIVSCVYDISNQTIYEVTFCPIEDKLYRWVNPLYKDALIAECADNGFLYNEAWDNIIWIDCDVDEDIIDKITSFYETGKYNSNVLVSVELTDEQWNYLQEVVDIEGITLDELATGILRDAIHQKKILMAADEALKQLQNGELDV